MNPQRTPFVVAFVAAVFLLRGPGSPPAAAPPAAEQLAAPITAALLPEPGPAPTPAAPGAPPAAPPSPPAAPADRSPVPAAWSRYARLFREELDTGPPPSPSRRVAALRGQLAAQPLDLEVSLPPAEKPVGNEDLIAIAKRANAGGARLEFLIALVADPVDSRLAADFDLSLRAVQAALARAEYQLDRIWLPWAEPEAVRQKLYREAAGMLLFRRDPEPAPSPARAGPPGAPPPAASCETLPPPTGASAAPSLLAVFVVGETPKLGIHKQAFHQAADFLLRLHAAGVGPPPPCLAPPPEIPVLGPAYSGSADSLRLVLENYPTVRFHVVSGSATAPEVESHLTGGSGSQLASRVWFSRTVMRDDDLANTAFTFLHERLGWRLDRAALLIEGDTVYGGHFLRDPTSAHPPYTIPPEVKRIAFPSNLVALRNAWQQSTFGPSAADAARARSSTVSKTTLEVSLTDQGPPPADVAPELSPLTPRIGDMALSNLLRQLAREKIQYVGILATDVKDELFLAEQIRRWAPNVILFVFDSNLLYIHPQYNATMFGTLAIASFPLVTEGAIPELSPAEPDPRYRRQFASAWQEGTFLAVRTLLGDPASEPPAVWISASGNYAMWPLARLVPPPPAGARALAQPPEGYQQAISLGPSARQRKQVWPLETPAENADLTLLFLLVVLGLASYALWRADARRAAVLVRTRWLSSAAAALLCLAGAGVVEVWIGRLHSRRTAPGAWGFLLVLLAAYGALVWVLLATTTVFHRRRPIVVVFLVTGLLLPWLLWVAFTFGIAGDRVTHLGPIAMTYGDIFFHLRVRAFSAGLSPLVSLAWLTVAACFWVAVEVRRQLVRERHRTAWPLGHLHEAVLAGCTADAERLEVVLARAFPSDRCYRLIMLTLVAGPTLFLWGTVQPIGESRSYGQLFILAADLICLLSLAAFFRFFAAWLLVLRLLRRVEHTALVAALRRVGKTIKWQPVRFGWYVPSFGVLKQSVERLQKLIDRGVVPQIPGRESLSELLELVVRCEAEGRFPAELRARARLERHFQWAYEQLENQRQAGIDDFLAAQLISYLRHVFKQLRYCLMGELGTGLAVIIAVATYAFEPKRYALLVLWTTLTAASAITLVFFVQMDRDAALSAIGGTKSGKVSYDWAFVSNVLTYAVVPALGLIASQFPSMGRLLNSLLDPLTRVLGTG
jgi:hypothetical protein